MLNGFSVVQVIRTIIPPQVEVSFQIHLDIGKTDLLKGMYSLRMYGASGSMFSSLQSAFIGDPSRGKKKGAEIRKIIKGQYDVTKNTKPTSILGIAQTLGIFEKDDNNRFWKS